jgi:hypothetical protein
MSLIFQPTGLRPMRSESSTPYSGGLQQYAVTTNNTLAIFAGDIVSLVGGSIVTTTANAVAGTLSANSPKGVVMGFEYQDANTPGRALVCAQFLPANAITSLGLTNIVALVHDGVGEKFTVQANGPVVQANIGKNANLVAGSFNSGSLPFKTSRLALDAATIAVTNTLSLRIIAFDKNLDTVPGDLFTRVVVRWNSGVHVDSLPLAQ